MSELEGSRECICLPARLALTRDEYAPKSRINSESLGRFGMFHIPDQ